MTDIAGIMTGYSAVHAQNVISLMEIAAVAVQYRKMIMEKKLQDKYNPWIFTLSLWVIAFLALVLRLLSFFERKSKGYYGTNKVPKDVL